MCYLDTLSIRSWTSQKLNHSFSLSILWPLNCFDVVKTLLSLSSARVTSTLFSPYSPSVCMWSITTRILRGGTLMPFCHTYTLTLSSRTTFSIGCFVALAASYLITLMQRGARFLNDTPIALWAKLIVYVIFTISSNMKWHKSNR